MFGEIVEIMIKSVSSLPRVEEFLFQKPEEDEDEDESEENKVQTPKLKTIELDESKVKEDILETTRQRVRTVIVANSHGPSK